MNKSLKLVLGMGAVAGLLAPAHAAPFTTKSMLTNQGEIVACSDCNAPGMPLFTTLGSSMDPATIDEDGLVLFGTTLAGPTISTPNSRAMYFGTLLANLSVVAQWSDPAPNLPGLYLVSNSGTQGIGDKRVAPDGGVMFVSRLSNDAHNLAANVDTALFGGMPGSFSPIAREGDLAPGTIGAVYGDLASLSTQYMAIGRNGHVMFVTNLTGGDVVGTTNDVAIYGGTVAAPVLAVRKGATMMTGVTAAAFSGQNTMDDNGRIIYNLKLAGPGVTNETDESIWLYTPGVGNTLIMREGDPAPGTAGAVFSTVAGTALSTPRLTTNSFTRNGKYAFGVALSGGDVVAGVNDEAVYVGQTGGAITLFGRKGAPAPGTDAVFANFHPTFTFIADSGRVVFEGQITGGTSNSTNDTGIWVGTSGALTLVAREGSVAPGTNGAKFIGFAGTVMSYSDYGVIFYGEVNGGDVIRNTNAKAFFAWTPAQGTFLVARAGDSLQTPTGPKITSIFGSNFFGNTNGAALGFSNNGMVAFNTTFDSGAGVMTVDLNCAPSTDYYLDADHDGHGDPTTQINRCAGFVPPPNYITTAGDCLDSDPGALGQSVETCNGIDDDCDAMIDEGIPIPSGPIGLSVGKGSGNNVLLSWNAVSGATRYDVVAGDLTELRGAGGYQFLGQAQCIGNDVSGTALTVNTPVNPGLGKWWVMRPINCDGDGTFSSGAPKERPGRDQEINSSFYQCP